MHSYHKEATVGAIVILGILVFLGGALWLSGHSFSASGKVPVLYADIGNLKQGAPVRISGASVGRVDGIIYQDVGKVVVTLKMDRKKVHPAANATAVILSVGMLGDAVIDFDPGKGPEMTESDTLKGTLGKGDLMEMGAKLADKAVVTMDALNRMLDTNVVKALRHTLLSTDRLMTYLSDTKDGPAAELAPTLRAFKATGARLDSVLASVDVRTLQTTANNTLKSADSTSRAVAKMTAQAAIMLVHVDSLMTDIQHGKGTLGKLNSDTMLYHRITELTQQMTLFIAELAKNPGKIGITIKVP